MAAAPLQPPSNMRASQSAPPITILPIVDSVVSGSITTFIRSAAVSEDHDPDVSLFRWLSQRSGGSAKGIESQNPIQRSPTGRLGPRRNMHDWYIWTDPTARLWRSRPIGKSTSAGSTWDSPRQETCPAHHLANAFDTLHSTWQLQLKLPNTERIRIAAEIAHIHELLNEQVAKTDRHKARIRKLEEDKELSETNIQDDEDKIYALTEKVAGLEIRLKDTRKVILSCERDSLDDCAKAEAAPRALKAVEAELAIYKTQSQSAPLQTAHMPPKPNQQARVLLSPRRSEPAHLSLLLYPSPRPCC